MKSLSYWAGPIVAGLAEVAVSCRRSNVVLKASTQCAVKDHV